MLQRCTLVFGVMTLLFGGAGVASAVVYSVTDITDARPGITGACEAMAISSNGRYVTGYATYSDGQPVFLYDTTTSTYSDLGKNGTANLQGWGVNSSGQIVASASNVGYYYSGGTWTQLLPTLQAHVTTIYSAVATLR